MSRIVILGAGFGGLYTARHLEKALRGTETVEVVPHDGSFPASGKASRNWRSRSCSKRRSNYSSKRRWRSFYRMAVFSVQGKRFGQTRSSGLQGCGPTQ